MGDFAAKEPYVALWPQPIGDSIAFHFVRRLRRFSQIENFATARLGSGKAMAPDDWRQKGRRQSRAH